MHNKYVNLFKFGFFLKISDGTELFPHGKASPGQRGPTALLFFPSPCRRRGHGGFHRCSDFCSYAASSATQDILREIPCCDRVFVRFLDGLVLGILKGYISELSFVD